MKEKGLREFFCRKRGVKRLNRNYQKELEKLIQQVKKQMQTAAADLNFEMAAQLRDKMIELKKNLEEL